MQTLEQLFSDWAQAAFAAEFPDTDLAGTALDVQASDGERFGDYQCNAAMALARVLRLPPREIAGRIAARRPFPDGVEAIEVAGPGFLNLRISTPWLAHRLEMLAEDPPRLGTPPIGDGQTVVIDYSSPNVAKRMHIGHIRSTIIGNALDRFHRFLGYRVIADNHLGDWGTQFGILIVGYRNLLDEVALARDPVGELERLYVASYGRAETDPDWMDQARRELVKLQQGNEENLALWHRFVEWSLGEFNRVYERLGVRFDLQRGESYYNDRLPALLADLANRQIARPSEGAQVVFLEEEKLPLCIVQKSDGAANYATTDLATILSRVEEFAPDRIIYVTDARQQTHFRQVFAIARRIGIRTGLEHVWFGLMRLPEGVFSNRKGNVIRLNLLLDEAEARALSVVQASSPDMPPEQQREVARAVGIGAVKYADLGQNPQSDVVFTWDKALSLEGNSAPYLQYACARIASVEDKYRERFPDGDLSAHPIRIGEPVERRLALQLVRFPEAVIRAAASYRPNLLAEYLFDVAQTYSSLYQNVPFLKADAGIRESRVRLSGLTALVLRKGLDLLGIETPDRI